MAILSNESLVVEAVDHIYISVSHYSVLVGFVIGSYFLLKLCIP